MDKFYIYDKETDTIYVSENDGFGWFGLFILLATPFFIIGVWLKEYATFVSKYMLPATLAFLGFGLVVGFLLYKKHRKAKRGLGIVAVIISLLPIWIGQVTYAIPYILAQDDYFLVSFEWLIITFFTVGISFFVIQISMLLKNGLTHLMIAGIYLVAAILVFL